MTNGGSVVRNGRRDRKKEAFWRRIVRGQATSGLSIRAWCRRQRVREASFYWWRTQLAQRDEQAPAFVPVRVTAEPAVSTCGTSRIEVVLPGERCVRLLGPVDRQALADVLAVLADEAPSDHQKITGRAGTIASRTVRSC